VEEDIRGHVSPERISGRLRLEGQPYASPKAIRRFAHSRHFESYLYRKGLNRRWRGYGHARQERFAGRACIWRSTRASCHNAGHRPDSGADQRPADGALGKTCPDRRASSATDKSAGGWTHSARIAAGE